MLTFYAIHGNALTQIAIFAQICCTRWIKHADWRRWKLYKEDWRKQEKVVSFTRDAAAKLTDYYN